LTRFPAAALTALTSSATSYLTRWPQANAVAPQLAIGGLHDPRDPPQPLAGGEGPEAGAVEVARDAIPICVPNLGHSRGLQGAPTGTVGHLKPPKALPLKVSGGATGSLGVWP